MMIMFKFRFLALFSILPILTINAFTFSNTVYAVEIDKVLHEKLDKKFVILHALASNNIIVTGVKKI